MANAQLLHLPASCAAAAPATGESVQDFAAFYRRHVARVYALCLRLTGLPALAEDCTQDCFISAWRALADFRGESTHATWLHRIAVNAVLGQHRRGHQQGAIAPRPAPAGPAAWAFPGAPMNSPEAYRSVDAALASLPVEIAPPHDLWPAIAQSTGSLRSAGSRPWPVALAASLALFTLVAALSWFWQRPPARLALAPSQYELPQNVAYQATRTALEHTFAERLQLLAPATRARVQQDLELITNANADIRAALKSDPASPLLLQLLPSTWQQEFNLYTTVTRSTDTLLTRRS